MIPNRGGRQQLGVVGIGDGCRRSRQIVQRCRGSVLTQKGSAKVAAGICGGWTGKFGDGITRERAAAWLGWETTRAGQHGNGRVGVKQAPSSGWTGARCPTARTQLSKAGNDGVAQLQPWIGLGVGDRRPATSNWR